MENVIPLGENKSSFALLREAFRFVNSYHKDEFDWILKTNDNSYIVMENLRYLLYQYDSDWPVVIGQRYLNDDYMIGVYAVSKRAFTRLIENAFRNKDICHEITKTDDIDMAKCFQHLNVLLIDGLDEDGRGLFFANNMEKTLFPLKVDDYDKFYWHKFEQGIDKSVSDQLIAIQGLSGTHLYYMEYYMYKVRVFGMQRKMKPLPKKLTLDKIVMNKF